MTLNRITNTYRSVRLWFWATTFALGLAMALISLTTPVAAEDENTGREESAAAQQQAGGTGLVFTVDGAIGPATMDYLVRGLARAEEEEARLVIIRMDTPGGLMKSMRAIIQEILDSPVPVVTYVSPPGSRAASAGTYILYGSHVAAMAPATHLGSATPVQMGGMPGSPDDSQGDGPTKDQSSDGQQNGDGESKKSDEASGEQAPTNNKSAMERKLIEDSVAYIRELANRHGRNADWAEKAVREAVNLGAEDAVEMNVADVVAKNINELLTKIDGFTVVMSTGERTLETQNLSLTRVDPDWRTQLLSVITDPNVAYFLMIIGFYGIIFELSNPGSLVPGVIGAISLILALFAFQVLSVNYAGLALILLGLAFIVGEAFVPSFGILGIGGIVAFVVGSVILMDGTNQDVSLPLIGGVAAVASGFMLWAVTRFLSLRTRHVVSGVEQMVHEEAVAMDDFTSKDDTYEGKVILSGERWHAVSNKPVHKDQRLQVLDVKGLTAYVAPKD